jgi:holo-[acyl-carrier protein] synthase
MILGLGSDIVDIRRIEKTIARYGERFLGRVFTDAERLKSERRADRASSYAKRFAAKEACAKALGTGLRRGVYWRDMGVINMRSGRPTMVLGGGAAEQLKRITPQGYSARIDVTLSDEFPLAQAVVVISGVAVASPAAIAVNEGTAAREHELRSAGQPGIRNPR